MFEKLKNWFNASEKPITAGYNPGPSMLWWAYTNKRPPWNYYYADVMLLDPQVWFGVNIGNGPLLSAKVTVKPGSKLAARSDAAEIQEFIAQQWQRIWSTSAAQILRCKHYGFMAYEVVYKTVDDRIEFDYLRDFHPFDVGELKLAGGGRVGVRIHNIQRPGGGSVDLIGPKGLWITYDDEFCRTWGRALLQRAYAPWYDKNSDGGAFDLRRLRNFKDAWIGDLIRYPLKQIRTPNGQFVSGRDLAREIGENRASGVPIFLPSTRDQSGNYEWDYSPPQGVAGDSGIPQWIGDLDWDILDGLLVPREVVEASQTGSGFSGRSVPLVGFLSIRDLEFGGYVRQIKGQSLKPLARANYGLDADDFDLVPTPLVETTGELMGGMGQPDSRNAGGDGAGQDGKGQEAGGVEKASGIGRQASGSQNGGMQFSTDDSGHWITIGAVRGGDGKRHGGTPVKIVGGKIVSGPKRLRGKSIKRLASRLRGRKRRGLDSPQFSIVDPPDRDTPTSQPAQAKDSAADAANAFSAETRRRLDKLLKKND